MEHNWEELYQKKDTGWDIGYPSTPLKEYIDQLENKALKILIPGAGNSHEAEYLFQQGFSNVWIIDIAPSAITNFKTRVADFPKEQILLGDFFEHQAQYDLIFEQTFFCAIHPSKRKPYAKKMKELLYPTGKLVGLFFNDRLNMDHPPYGGNQEEYLSIFSPYFENIKMDTCYNSIEPRASRELFVMMQN